MDLLLRGAVVPESFHGPAVEVKSGGWHVVEGLGADVHGVVVCGW
jgi:hypothetical protein